MIAARVRALDVFLAEQIDAGLVCHFTPCEAMYGIFSIGCLAAYVATLHYVSGEAPLVAALMSLARLLDFGAKGTTVSYTKYSHFVDALNEVDRFELVFDIKAVVGLVVDALKKKALRVLCGGMLT